MKKRIMNTMTTKKVFLASCIVTAFVIMALCSNQVFISQDIQTLQSRQDWLQDRYSDARFERQWMRTDTERLIAERKVQDERHYAYRRFVNKRLRDIRVLQDERLESLYLQVLSYTVTVHVGRKSYGSGVILNSDTGYILTAAHVVEHCSDVIIQFYDGKRVYAERISVDPYGDVALLRVLPSYMAYLQLDRLYVAKIDELRIGESVFAVGTPYWMEDTVSCGVLSRKITNGSSYANDYLVIDAIGSPGSSGCPVFNFDLQIVGLITGPIDRYTRVASCVSIMKLFEDNQI